MTPDSIAPSPLPLPLMPMGQPVLFGLWDSEERAVERASEDRKPQPMRPPIKAPSLHLLNKETHPLGDYRLRRTVQAGCMKRA